MENFTPWTSLAGGALLGVSAFILMFCNAKTAGISGIVGGLLQPKKGDIGWRLLFLIGMFMSLFLLAPFSFSPPEITLENPLLIIISGILVGLGTRLGNGCTSGHGIVGMARLSPRSIVATLVFMGAAMLTVFMRNLIGDL